MRICTRTWLKAIIILLSIDAVAPLVLFALKIDSRPYCEIVACVLLAISFVLLFSNQEFVVELTRKKKALQQCTFIHKEDCPYTSQEQCPYDSANCCAYPEKPKGKWKINLMFFVGIFAIAAFLCCTVFDIVPKDSEWNQPLLSLSISAVVAVLMTLLIDMPGRMKEYRNYFVGLLSSSEYLKEMSLEQLSALRHKITWLQHIKDLPNMPTSMIDLDDRICRMLTEPYFKEYSQVVSVSESNGMLQKHNQVEFRAFNPYGESHMVSMDVGMAFSLVFKEADGQFEGKENIEKQSKDLVHFNKFEVWIDKEEKSIDLLPHISIITQKQKREGFQYNGSVHVSPKDTRYDKDHPLTLTSLSQDANNSEEVPKYDYNPSQDKRDLYIAFRDKLHVIIDYVIKIPKTDVSFTKRLRYPVKYFRLDYSLNDNALDGYRLGGQLLGTLLDQEDVSVVHSDNRRRIIMNTHSWLLTKNGAVVVHEKND